MKKLELHSHSNASPDSLVSPEQLQKILLTGAIDMIAITDHNTIQNAVRLFNEFPDRIIIGEEIEVTYQGRLVGELLAYFIQEEIPAGLDVFTVLEELQQQNAYISLPHPMDTFRTRWTAELLTAMMPFLDGIEVFNGRCLMQKFNEDALALALVHKKHSLVGSDAHSFFEIGRSYQIVDEFDGVEGFRKVLTDSNYKTKKSPFWVHGLSRLAVFQNQVKSAQDRSDLDNQ